MSICDETMKTYQQIPQQDDDGHLANGRNIEGGLLLDFGAEVLEKYIRQRNAGDGMEY